MRNATVGSPVLQSGSEDRTAGRHEPRGAFRLVTYTQGYGRRAIMDLRSNSTATVWRPSTAARGDVTSVGWGCEVWPFSKAAARNTTTDKTRSPNVTFYSTRDNNPCSAGCPFGDR